MVNIRIITEHLELIAGTTELVRAEIDNRLRFATLLNAQVSENWPPPLNDIDSMEWFAHSLAENPDMVGWSVWYFVLLESVIGKRIAIGNGGFKGKPSLDGTVEIGYSLLAEFQGIGYGTEAVCGLISWAFQEKQVDRIIAETYPELISSIRVLEKNGFVKVGKGIEEGTICFELLRNTYADLKKSSNL
ncbi:MAG: GNAT family N-acetyltransferase [Acidobacteriota bacterium]